jgi:hypothetical protein
MSSETPNLSLGSRINAWPRGLFALVVGALTLLSCALVYPPRMEVWAHRNPSLQEWSRADSFLKQCQSPLSQEVEPAVRWRLLPPLVCHALGLKGRSPLAFCWAGLAVFAVALAGRLDQLTGQRAWAAIGAIGIATSGPFITALDWLGLNDGWYLLALVEVVAARSGWTLWAWACLGPWIDERFLFGLPLAIFVRIHLRPVAGGSTTRIWTAAVAGIAPYLLFRTAFSLSHGDGVSRGYVADMVAVFGIYASHVPAGWLMGFRVGWWVLLIPFLATNLAWRSRLVGFLAAVIPLFAISVLAWDLDRSTGILIPLYVFGIVRAAQLSSPGDRGSRRRHLQIALVCLAVNFALPYAHVVGPTVSWNRGPGGIWRGLAGR